VSALVHSRTLITGGVVLIGKFYRFLTRRGGAITRVSCLALVSRLFGGAKGFLESDFKKIIAFSTLTQISLIVLAGSLNLKTLMLFHIIIHAGCKFLLFLRFGRLIYRQFGSQEGRKRGGAFRKLERLLGRARVINLLGVLFVSGFVSKEAVLRNVLRARGSLLVKRAIFLRLMFTVFYSLVLLKILLKVAEKIKTEEDRAVKLRTKGALIGLARRAKLLFLV